MAKKKASEAKEQIGGFGVLTTEESALEERQRLFWKAFLSFRNDSLRGKRIKELERLTESFRRASDGLDVDSPDLWGELLLEAKVKTYDPKGYKLEFTNALKSWLETCNLSNVNWMPELVLEFLDMNSLPDSEYDPSIFGGLGGFPEPSSSKPPTLPRFDPEVSSVKDYTAWAGKTIEKYIATVINDHKAIGLKPTQLKRNRHGSPMAHYEWLVRYQVLGEEFSEITNRLNHYGEDNDLKAADDTTVSKAVSSLAKQIGLILRQPAKINTRARG
jgi:hypothetical protein